MKRRIKKASGLPKLVVAIYRGDVFVRNVELDDPREAYCRSYNSCDVGTVAYPVSRAISLAKSKRRPE